MALIPNIPIAEEMVVQVPHPSGKGLSFQLHPVWKQWFQQLTTALQNNISNEGFNIPQVNTTQLAVLNNTNSIGRFIYDSDNGVMKVNNNGTYKEIMTM